LLDLASNFRQDRSLVFSDSLLQIPDDAPPILKKTLEHWKEAGGMWGVVPPGKPTAFLPPLYPLALSVLIGIPGNDLLAARLFGACLGALTSYLVYAMAVRLGRKKRAIAAGLLLAVSPLAVYQSVEISTHCLAAFTLLLPFWILGRGSVGFGRGILVGAAAGIAFLARPTAWTVVPLSALWALGAKRDFGLALGIVMGAASVIMPWVARNAISLGEPLAFTTNAGRNLWEFNNQKLAPEYEWSEPPDSRRMYDPIRERRLSTIRQRELLPFPSFTDEPEWERDRILQERFYGFVRANPLAYLELVGVRTSQILAIAPLHYGGVTRIIFSTYYLPFLVLACTGLWLSLFGGGLPRVMAAFVLAFFVVHALTAAGFVYRGMITPILAFFASYALWPPRDGENADGAAGHCPQ
jgi:hypothetical protein